MATVLVTGVCGSLAQLCAEELLDAGHDVVGVDYRRRRPGTRRAIKFYQANYNKRIIADVFRKHRPNKVLHLGRVGNLRTQANKRFDLNVIGSAKIMELCLEFEVERLVVLSTFHIYGAHPNNHTPIFEDEPLRAMQSYPQLSDAVQLDNMACTWAYRYRQLRSVVLRPCNIAGPNIQNAISTYLRAQQQFYLLGFSPMWQFIHETDMVRALMATLAGEEVGIYNVAGKGEIPLVAALELTKARLIPMPSTVASLALKVTGSTTIPAYFLDFLRYHCVISDAKFRKDFDFRPTMGPKETIESTVFGV